MKLIANILFVCASAILVSGLAMIVIGHIETAALDIFGGLTLINSAILVAMHA